MSQISSISRRATYTTSFGKAISKRAPPSGLLEARRVPPYAEPGGLTSVVAVVVSPGATKVAPYGIGLHPVGRIGIFRTERF